MVLVTKMMVMMTKGRGDDGENDDDDDDDDANADTNADVHSRAELNAAIDAHDASELPEDAQVQAECAICGLWHAADPNG